MKKVVKWMGVLILVAAVFTAIYVMIPENKGTVVAPIQEAPIAVNEFGIQKELTQKDIQRLQGYPINEEYKEGLENYPYIAKAEYGTFGRFNNAYHRNY
ncbi:MAG: hypothetical protein ACM3KR_08745 [Deltaproteobacteria bacterium]